MTALEVIERDRQGRQTSLDGERSQSERNQLGQFATPELLALQMAEVARRHWSGDSPVRFLDPAIGSGAFFSALVRVFPKSLIESARGVEIDRRFVHAARELWSDAGLQVDQGDFTRLSPPRSAELATLVLANPPYVRHHHLDAGEKGRLRQAVASSRGLDISGLAGLYAYFILLAHRWMEPGALAVWLVPSEFLDVNYGVTLRRYLRDQATLLQLHRFDPSDVQFTDALVSSAVLVFRAAPPAKNHMALFTQGGDLVAPRLKRKVSLGQLSPTAKWSGVSRQSRQARAQGPQFSDLFSVKRGIATGANNFFVLPRSKAKELRLPDRYLRPILPSPRNVTDLVIESEPDGYPAIEEQLVLIDCSVPEERLRREAPELLAYLETGEKRGIRDRYLVSRRAPWYQQERRDPPPFLCTYMGRGVGAKSPFRFMWNKSQAIAANVYLMLYPVEAMKAALDKDPSLYQEVFRLLCAIEPDSLRREGRVYGGALHKLEPRELGQLPAATFEALIPESLRRSPQFALALS